MLGGVLTVEANERARVAGVLAQPNFERFPGHHCRSFSPEQLAHESGVLTYIDGVRIAEWFLAVNLRTMKTKMRWRAQLIMLCALVFMFALHAKTSVYSRTGPAKATPSTASKLWLSGQKMEVQSVDSGSGMLFWMAVLCLVGLYLHRELRARSAFLAPFPKNLPLRQVHRFLRPPPLHA